MQLFLFYKRGNHGHQASQGHSWSLQSSCSGVGCDRRCVGSRVGWDVGGDGAGAGAGDAVWLRGSGAGADQGGAEDTASRTLQGRRPWRS